MRASETLPSVIYANFGTDLHGRPWPTRKPVSARSHPSGQCRVHPFYRSTTNKFLTPLPLPSAYFCLRAAIRITYRRNFTIINVNANEILPHFARGLFYCSFTVERKGCMRIWKVVCVL